MDKVKAREVLDRIDEILRWEQRMESYKDQKFAELGKHLCEVRNQGYWRLGYGSFEAYLAAKFPDCRRKAYYLMSIHDNLRQIPTDEIESLGWSKALELAKVARSQGRRFDSQTWLNKAKESSKQGSGRQCNSFLERTSSPMRWFISSCSRASCRSLSEPSTWPLGWRERSGHGASVWS